MIHTIPYFDAHCDTIHRCHTAGTLFRDPELRAFYDIAGNLRRSGGHIDLERAGGFARYAQFFALYQNPRLVPKGSSMPEQGVLLHQRFLREMEENRERILPCRTGAEVDEAVGQGKAAALLSIEGAELLDCDIRRLDTAYDWGVRLTFPDCYFRCQGLYQIKKQEGLSMSLMDEFKKIIHPYDDEDDDYEEDVGRDSEPTYFEPREPREPRESSRRKEVSAEERRNKVVNIHATTQLKVVLVKPERFENASEIADHLREKRTVVLNLEGTNKDVARRLVDFLSGVAYAGDGKIKKVSTNTYIITPYSVDLMGDLIDELENNGLYL